MQLSRKEKKKGQRGKEKKLPRKGHLSKGQPPRPAEEKNNPETRGTSSVSTEGRESRPLKDIKRAKSVVAL